MHPHKNHLCICPGYLIRLGYYISIAVEKAERDREMRQQKRQGQKPCLFFAIQTDFVINQGPDCYR
jgi:hypothetical protein